MSGEDQIERVADELRRLESEGGTLDDILNGEAGWCWIEEACFDRWAVIEEMLQHSPGSDRLYAYWVQGSGCDRRRLWAWTSLLTIEKCSPLRRPSSLRR